MRLREVGTVLFAGVLLTGSASGAEERHAAYRRLVGEGDEALSLRGAVEGAKARLARERCQGVLTEFTDASGRTLQQNLDALGVAADAYLDWLVFYDAAGTGRCGSGGALAMTTPGSRVVLVCGARFTAMRRKDRRHTEVIMIHEALHTLGLGENPPSSSEITSRVLARCGS